MNETRTVMMMKYNHIGPKERPDAIIITYRVRKGANVSYKTLTLTGTAECTWYEWNTENQALDEHEKAVAYYRRMQ